MRWSPVSKAGPETRLFPLLHDHRDGQQCWPVQYFATAWKETSAILAARAKFGTKARRAVKERRENSSALTNQDNERIVCLFVSSGKRYHPRLIHTLRERSSTACRYPTNC